MEYDDELVLMVDDRVHVLAGLGVLIWLALEVPCSATELVARAQELWGEHPEAPGLVSDALALMTEEGMIAPPLSWPTRHWPRSGCRCRRSGWRRSSDRP